MEAPRWAPLSHEDMLSFLRYIPGDRTSSLYYPFRVRLHPLRKWKVMYKYFTKKYTAEQKLKDVNKNRPYKHISFIYKKPPSTSN